MGAVLALGMAVCAAAQSAPGRIQLSLGGLEHRAAEVGDVSLDGSMLQLGLRMLAKQEGGGAEAQVLSRLQGVYVKSLRFDGSGEYSASDLSDILRQLRAPGWSRILSARSRHEQRQVDVYVMKTAQGVAGMAIIAQYPNELRVVNLVGAIDPAALSQLGGHFGIPRVDPHGEQDGSDHDQH